MTMATHGTDQDMVQRMLTAPDIRRSRRSLIMSGLADIRSHSRLSIGVLLWVFLPDAPGSCITENSERDLLSLHSLRDAGRPAWSAHCRHFCNSNGFAQHSDQRVGYEFYPGWYEPISNPASTANKVLRAVRWGHGLVLSANDLRRVYNSLPRHRAPNVRII